MSVSKECEYQNRVFEPGELQQALLSLIGETSEETPFRLSRTLPDGTRHSQNVNGAALWHECVLDGIYIHFDGDVSGYVNRLR